MGNSLFASERIEHFVESRENAHTLIVSDNRCKLFQVLLICHWNWGKVPFKQIISMGYYFYF